MFDITIPKASTLKANFLNSSPSDRPGPDSSELASPQKVEGTCMIANRLGMKLSPSEQGSLKLINMPSPSETNEPPNLALMPKETIGSCTFQAGTDQDKESSGEKGSVLASRCHSENPLVSWSAKQPLAGIFVDFVPTRPAPIVPVPLADLQHAATGSSQLSLANL
ncbi:unnamed protein product, partial [Protopolystoma xenopodis]